MANIKTSGTSPESAIQAEKEFQLARQQAEMKAGEALFRQAAQKITEQREKARSDNTETEESQPKDTAQLSEAHLRPHAGETGNVDESFKWVLEMAGKDWEILLKWQPESGMPLPSQLEELSVLYLALLEAALKYTEGEHLAWQMERLDSLLAEKLSAVMEQNLEELTHLLEQTGNTAATDSIRSSLYRQTAGRTLSPQAAHRLFLQETAFGRGSTRPFTAASSSSFTAAKFSGKGMNNQLSAKQDTRFQQTYSRQQSKASSPFSGEGMIYQPSRKQNVRFQQVYYGQQNSWKEQIRQRKEMISSASKGIAENTFRGTGLVSCSAKELETANRFAAHLNGRGNLFQNPDITARNDEITGLLAAVMSIKGQVYTAQAGQTSSLALNLQNAIEKMVDHYLSQKGVTNVYYHTLAAYEKIRNPQKAIQSGQDYAYQRFCEKQKNPAYQKSAAYSRDAGFFRSLLKQISPEKDFALGTNALQKDWENFLHAIGRMPKPSYLSSKAKRYSPWGILMNPGTHRTGISTVIINILLGTAVVILLGILTVFFFRMGA